MRVYIIRHGHAVPSHGSVPDAARWLHAEGRRLLGAAGTALREAGVQFDAVVSSPLVRAVQTAELLAAAVGYGNAVEALLELAPDGSPGRVADALPTRGLSVAAVGHEPSISTLAGHLAGRRLGAFRPGQVVCIEDGVARWSFDADALSFARF